MKLPEERKKKKHGEKDLKQGVAHIHFGMSTIRDGARVYGINKSLLSYDFRPRKRVEITSPVFSKMGHSFHRKLSNLCHRRFHF